MSLLLYELAYFESSLHFYIFFDKFYVFLSFFNDSFAWLLYIRRGICFTTRVGSKLGQFSAGVRVGEWWILVDGTAAESARWRWWRGGAAESTGAVVLHAAHWAVGWTIAAESDWQLSNDTALTPDGRPFGQLKRGDYPGYPNTSSREAFVLAVGQFWRLCRANCPISSSRDAFLLTVGQFSGRVVVNYPFFLCFSSFCKFVGEFLRYIEANCPFRLVWDVICNFFGEFKHFARLYFPIASSRWKVMALVGQSPRD